MTKDMTIPNDAGPVSVQYAPAFSCLCTVGHRPFYGTVRITFAPGDRLLEFEAFERWLVGLALESFTIESLCRTVFDKLTDVLGDVPLSVAAEARTTVHAPVTATIERS